MATNYRPSLKTSRMTAVRDDIDSGSGAGTLEICTASYASVLLTITLNDPSGTISSDVLTFSGFPKSATASASGTATIARIKNSDGTVVVSGLSVGTSGSDINMSSNAITSGENVEITAMTITHAA